jgi:hypothetical protein
MWVSFVPELTEAYWPSVLTLQYFYLSFTVDVRHFVIPSIDSQSKHLIVQCTTSQKRLLIFTTTYDRYLF